jgi:hypothetical protein
MSYNDQVLIAVAIPSLLITISFAATYYWCWLRYR